MDKPTLPDDGTPSRLFPIVYEELRSLAAAKLRGDGDSTFQPTDLVHEAYLRLARGRTEGFENRRLFFAAAAEAMRRILVDRARRRNARKRRPDGPLGVLDDVPAADGPDPADILSTDEALKRLESHDPRSAELVKLRYFAGLTIPEVAQTLGVSTATVDNDWAYIKTWLRLEIHGRNEGNPPDI